MRTYQEITVSDGNGVSTEKLPIVIDKSQYRSFSCKLGKKNKITKVIGNQYIIDSSTETSYEEGERECSPNDLSNVSKYRAAYQRMTARTLFNPTAVYYLRKELRDMTVYYAFTVTGKTITSISDMYAAYTLYYNTYKKEEILITDENYQASASKNLFSAIKQDSNRPSSSKKDDGTYIAYDGSTTTAIPEGLASGYYSDDDKQYIGAIYPPQKVAHECKFIYMGKSKNADGVNYDYKFRVECTFNYSNGNNEDYINWWTGAITKQICYYNEVVKIRIEVHGYTVDKEEVSSSYSKTGDESKVLELQTNELMQHSVTPVEVDIGQKVIAFDDVADEIITAYKDNRLIASFDLVNNRKYMIEGEERFLRAGDTIKIKDLEDKYLSSSSETSDSSVGNDFEIIKANSKYNGFYYREIVAKEILNTIQGDE